MRRWAASAAGAWSAARRPPQKPPQRDANGKKTPRATPRARPTGRYKFLGLEPPPAGADKTVKMHPTDIPWYDYIGRKDPATGEVTCPWRRGRGKVQSGGSSGVQMAG